MFLSVSRRRDRERYGSRAKANQQLSKRSWSRSGRTLLFCARDVVVANVLGPRCVRAVVGRQAPRQEERATLPTQCVFAFLFRSQALHSSRIAKRCRSNLTLLALVLCLRQRGMTEGFDSEIAFTRDFDIRFAGREILLTFIRVQNLDSLSFECYKTQ